MSDVIHHDLVALWHKRLRNAPRIHRIHRMRRRGRRVSDLLAAGHAESTVRRAIFAGRVPRPVSPLTRQEAHSLATARRWNSEGVRGSAKSTWNKEVGACPM